MRFGRIAGLVLSLFLPAFYRHVARNWGGIGILYLLLLFTLAWTPSLVKIHLAARKFADEDFRPIANKLPDITIKNAKISSPVPQPFEIKDDAGNPVFVLDTTGKINNIDQTRAMFLVTETKIWQRDPQTGQIQIHDLNQMQFPDFEFTADWLHSWVDIICTWLALGLYPFLLLFSLIRALVLMLLASIAGLIFNAALNARVTYGGLLRFAAVGMTLSVYIDTGLDLAGIQVPFWFFIALALTIAYVGFGTFVSVPPIVNVDYDPDADDWRGVAASRRRRRRRIQRPRRRVQIGNALSQGARGVRARAPARQRGAAAKPSRALRLRKPQPQFVALTTR